ncbi:TetR/AcrR family transcriptional regulator [Chryseolinea sp. T2]|uniref:TetR/AcrR family transcriptional regulator n=1 Tax=Chryseolinea sp. T2 TaxID=3129255 RepID=UPI003077E5B7
MARSKDFDENEVLARAVKLFWLKGYNGTSMQDLVDTLGISRSSLYDTYVDKHTLYLKALEFYKSASQKEICDIAAKTASAKDAMKRLLEFVTNGLLSDKEHKGCFMLNAEVEVAAQDSEVMQIVCENDRQIEEAFLQVIRRGQKSGDITSKKDAKVLTRFFVNTIKGIRVSVKSTNDRAFFRDIIQTSLSVLEQ